MPILFNLRRVYDRGYPIGAARVFEVARGTLIVAEARDDLCHRVVRTATFQRVDGGEAVPVLRDVALLAWNGTTGSLTGYEEVAADTGTRSQRLVQTWLVEPESHAELQRAERLLGRTVGRLRQLGVVVDMLPSGELRIAGETNPDGTRLGG